jgi:hypothetical protein
MLKMLRYGATCSLVTGLMLVLGCSDEKPNANIGSNGAEVHHEPNFSLNTPLETIAADKSGKRILDRDVPGIMASRDYFLFDDMSLSQIASLSGGELTATKLDLVQVDLSKLCNSRR